VIGIRGALKVLHVTVGAGGICGSQVVVVVHMAGTARHAHMRSGEWKPGGTVVKVGLKPCIHSVAGLAICGKASRHVIRCNGVLEIPRVTGIALGRQSCELPGCTALMACDAITAACAPSSGKRFSWARTACKDTFHPITL